MKRNVQYDVERERKEGNQERSRIRQVFQIFLRITSILDAPSKMIFLNLIIRR